MRSMISLARADPPAVCRLRTPGESDLSPATHNFFTDDSGAVFE
ncbi:MAG: hypothetical protein ACRDWF_09260 [Acidimicrobiia bacterium]